MRRTRDASPVRVPSPVLIEDPGSIAETLQIVHRKLGLMFERLEQKGFAPILEEVLSRTSGRSRDGLELNLAKQIWKRFDTELLHMDDPRFALVSMRTGEWGGLYNTAWLAHEAFPEYAASLSVRVETALRIGNAGLDARETYRFLETAARCVAPVDDVSIEALRARWEEHNGLGSRYHESGAFGRTKMHKRSFAIGERFRELDPRREVSTSLWYIVRTYSYEHDFIPETPVQLLAVALACLRELGHDGVHTLWWLKAARVQLGTSDRHEWFAELKTVFDQLSHPYVLTGAFLSALEEKSPEELIELIARSSLRDGYFALRAS